MRLTTARVPLLALVLAAGMAGYYFGFFIPQARAVRQQRQLAGAYFHGGDFFPLWLTSRQLGQAGANPYTDATTRAIQLGLYGRALDPARPGDPPPHYRAFSYPLSADLLVWPLSQLPFRQVQLLLSLVLPILAVAGAWLWMRGLGIEGTPGLVFAFFLLYLTSYSLLEGLFALQPTILVVALMAGTCWALARNYYWFAGGLLSLATIKPQLSVLLTAWLVAWVIADWRRRHGFVFGFTVLFTLLVGASQFVLPGWIGLWLGALLDYRQYTAPPLLQLMMGRTLAVAFGLGLLLLAVVWGWRTRMAPAADADFGLQISFVLALTVVALPMGDAVYEHILLVPGLLVIYRERHQIFRSPGAPLWLARLFLAVLFWQWVAACGVAIALWMVPSWRLSSSILVLPLRLAASVPLIALALLTLLISRRLFAGTRFGTQTPAQ